MNRAIVFMSEPTVIIKNMVTANHIDLPARPRYRVVDLAPSNVDHEPGELSGITGTLCALCRHECEYPGAPSRYQRDQAVPCSKEPTTRNSGPFPGRIVSLYTNCLLWI